MRTLRVPRSASTIFGMSLVLVTMLLLPLVFMAALAQSADQRPEALRETFSAFTQPARDFVRRLLR